MSLAKETPVLLRTQKDEVIRLIAAAGLDSTEFVRAVQPSRYQLNGPLVSVLMQTPTGSSFRFEFLESALGMNRVSVFSPGEYGHEQIRAAGSWEDQVQQVSEWLSRLTNAER